ncbi:MAG: bacteriohopanetetrol glucosamine biosynthesis glycosyltransferase HpnI [Methylovirgula sp.]
MDLPSQSDLLYFVSHFCDLLAGIGCLYLLVAAAVVLRLPEHRRGHCKPTAPVTILKPLQGAEPNLAPRLRSFCNQEFDAPVEMICGMLNHSDPAASAVGEIARSAATAIELRIDARERGSNRKISNLVNMQISAHNEILVITDSDIEVGPGYLRDVVAELENPAIGAVTCLYHGVAASGVWSRFAALAMNAHFLPTVVVALSFGLAQPCFGSTIAMRRSTLARIGGFEAFADYLADDYAIGEAVRSAGYDVAIPNFTIAHFCFDASLPILLRHELRTARTIKSIDPLGYCGTVVTHPFALALLAALFGGNDPLLLAVIALACRVLLCRCVEHRFRLPRQPYELIPLRDLLSFAVFTLSFFGRSVSWRGYSYRVGSDGRLAPDRSVAP